jgi:hypothetical protein
LQSESVGEAGKDGMGPRRPWERMDLFPFVSSKCSPVSG